MGGARPANGGAGARSPAGARFGLPVGSGDAPCVASAKGAKGAQVTLWGFLILGP